MARYARTRTRRFVENWTSGYKSPRLNGSRNTFTRLVAIRITSLGQGFSSGGISIGSLLFETDGNLKLFHSAVMQSGSYAPLIQTVKEAQPMSDLVFQLSGCETAADRIQCIRRETTRVVIHCKLPCIYSLIQANHSITTIWGPTIDGTLVPRQHFESLRRGGSPRKISIMVTTVPNECDNFLTSQASTDPLGFIRRTFPFMNEQHLEELQRHNPLNVPKPAESVSNAMSDYYFQCPARNEAKTYSAD
jgi:carboxylesterase type B